MPNPSKRHHYIPVHIQNGFCNGKGTLFVYDKALDKVHEDIPDNIFYIKHRNTTVNPKTGEKSVWLEDLYTKVENATKHTIKKVIDSTADKPALTVYERLELSLYIALLYWRVPSIDSYAELVLDTYGLNAIHAKIESKDGEKVPEETLNKILRDEGFIKAYKLSATFAPFQKMGELVSVDSWKFYYQDPGFLMISDNPIITRQPEIPEQSLKEFMFAISCNRLLINTSSVAPANLDSGFTLDYNMALIEQSSRFVAHRDEGYLVEMIKYYKQFEAMGHAKSFKQMLFTEYS